MRFILAGQTILLLATALPPAAAARAGQDADATTGYYLDASPGRHVKAALNVGLGLPGAQVAEWSIYAPHAPTFDGQRDVKTTLTPGGHVVRELSALKRPMLASRLKGRGNEVRLTLSVETTLVARRLVPRKPDTAAPKVPALSAADVKLYTRATPTLDLAGKPFAAWLARHDLKRGKEESDLAFARRVYSFIRQHFTYEYRPGQDMHASAVCRLGKSDCGGLSALFAASLRAGGVPARLLQGRWARSEEPGAAIGGFAYKQWHVKAEFFAKGIGWVPVDMASAVLMPGRGEFAHFGNDPGDFITLHLDQDLVMPTLTGGRETKFGVQGIAYSWRGKGSPQAERYTESWTVE